MLCRFCILFFLCVFYADFSYANIIVEIPSHVSWFGGFFVIAVILGISLLVEPYFAKIYFRDESKVKMSLVVKVIILVNIITVPISNILVNSVIKGERAEWLYFVLLYLLAEIFVITIEAVTFKFCNITRPIKLSIFVNSGVIVMAMLIDVALSFRRVGGSLFWP